MIADIAAADIYSLPASTKNAWLLEHLNALVQHHRQNCDAYRRLLNAWGMPKDGRAATLAALPALAAPLFKTLELRSVPASETYKTLYSSGTSGQRSHIVLDRDTAAAQTRALVRIMQHWLGPRRLPMLIIDHPELMASRAAFSARAAGVQGLSFLGCDHTFALHSDMTLNLEAVDRFCQKYADQKVLLFGFTFMVWECFLQRLADEGQLYHLPDGVLLHGGGWKKLQAQAIDNQTFKQRVQDILGMSRVHDYYGMVEQVGAIFVACEQGHFHAPRFADVIIRSPGDWRPLPAGIPGVIEVLSVLPRSYPGHVLLTEDLGVLHGVDDCPCGRCGSYFNVLGRLPRADLRGCSDTFTTESRK